MARLRAARLRDWARRIVAPRDAASGTLVEESDVRAAYRLLLGREPDPDGWHNFSAMVGRAPVSELVGSLLSSAEFRSTPMHEAVQRRERDDLELVEIGDGLRLLVSPHDLLNAGMLRSGSYEVHLSAALDQRLRAGDVVCAVGANIGFHVVRAARRVGPEGHVFAFEAHPANAQLVARNVALNRLTNVTVLPLALSDTRGLHRHVAAQGTNGYVEPLGATPHGASEDSPLLQAVCLDDLRSLIGRVDVLQIDVEGSEARVLRGATRTIEELEPTIFSELCLGQLQRTSGTSGEEYLEPLRRLGYTFDALGFDGSIVAFGDSVAALCRHAREQPTSHIDIRCEPRR